MSEARFLIPAFIALRSQNEALFYILQVLNATKNDPGVSSFLGVVFDDATRILSSFLAEIPTKGLLESVLVQAEASVPAQPISWSRREKWCRQIVQAVAVIHSKDLVVGCMMDRPDYKIAIDAHDNAVFYGDFQETFHASAVESSRGRVPSEYATAGPITSDELFSVTPEVDIYR